jgi:uncharacterized membrane protein YbhN (UPF0104 family)
VVQGRAAPIQEQATEADGAPESDARRLRNGLLWSAGLGLLAVAVALAVPALRDVLTRATHAQVGWLVVAALLEVGSCLGYVAILRLVLHRGPAREVRRLAWAEMAFGAVVPLGGAGGLAVGAWAMRAWGIPWSRVANRSAVIFLLTSAVNVAVLGLAGLGILLGIGSVHTGIQYGIVAAVAGLGALALFGLVPWWIRVAPASLRGGRTFAGAQRLSSWVRDTLNVLGGRDVRLFGALAYLLLDIAALWACFAAVGQSPPIVALIAGYQIGYLSNLIPIPGAIGVLDGGLLAALHLYGLPLAPAATAIILYHTIALWLPALGGTAGFVALRRSLTERLVAEPELSASLPTATVAATAPRRLESRA